MPRVLLAFALVATAYPARPDAPPGLAVDVPVTAAAAGGALAAWGASELAKGALVPSSCRWCEPPALDRHVRARLVWSDPGAAGLLSDALVVALPASLAMADFFFADRDVRRASEDVLVAVEAIAFAGVGAQAVKFAVARRRPDAWARGARTAPDDDASFLSGHVSLAFASAGAFGTVARLRGYEHWPAVYAAGFGAAAAVGYLRVAADRHWFTDVAATAAFGAGVGIAVPLLLHRGHADRKVTITPLPLGVAGLGVSGAF
jgi:membrane-associated phospholipid phosphatase